MNAFCETILGSAQAAVMPADGSRSDYMNGMMRHPLRVLIRFFTALFLAALASGDFLLRVWMAGKADSMRARAEWLQRWSRVQLRNFHIDVTYHGEPPQRGLLVSNHLSYTDVLVYAAAQPLVFVSKSEVRHWPLLGVLTRCAGTLYLRRDKKSDVAQVAAQFGPIIKQEVAIMLFLEGTTSNGHQVLPFRSSLLSPAVQRGWPVTPVRIGYALKDGSVEDDVCYWRDISFTRHFLNLLSREKIRATVIYGEPLPPGPDRKMLAKELHARVCTLRGKHNET
jgi:1-acyl-sn-glycerol-3-phosphate acyltransferase